MKRIILLLSILSFSFLSFSQNTGKEHVGAWYMHIGNYKIAKKWSLYSEYHLRMYQPVGKWQQMIASVGITYHINEKVKTGLGYAFLPTESFDKGATKKTATEHRIWQYFFLNNQLGRFQFRHRYQLEERFLSSNTSADVYKTRIRYQLMMTAPITHDKKIDTTLYLVDANEFFLHLENNPFDQNRFYSAAGYKFNKMLDFQLGYMRQSFNNFSYDRLMFSWIISPDLTKKQ